MVTVQSGARSLRSRDHRETFHPVVGPMAEARALHVVQQRLRERALALEGQMVIWDVGLGAAANAVAALEGLEGCEAQLHSFDITDTALAFALEHAQELEYLAPFQDAAGTLLADGRVRVGAVEWLFHRGDFGVLLDQPPAPAPHAILYDPYSPASNPGMWTREHFERLRRRLDAGRPCLLSNYTRSTAVRVTLLLAGFFVGRGGATGEKEETTLASNNLECLESPLDAAWLGRVARSTKGAPLSLGQAGGPISAADLAALRAHPQFKLGTELEEPRMDANGRESKDREG